ncbi:MAG: hypothetical protein RQ739_15520, partial [Desulfotignum sp.]|nr:hypothetical protein [Desulfotignum sp.]
MSAGIEPFIPVFRNDWLCLQVFSDKIKQKKKRRRGFVSAPGKAGNFLSVKVRHSQRLATGLS